MEFSRDENSFTPPPLKMVPASDKKKSGHDSVYILYQSQKIKYRKLYLPL